ncbi:uncharacterized protein Z519_01078 [Cladophialophora bantiana CBS 173.52]|uniref:Uncharacterized protein n=1 Tax=Cladophialophora bantiana (strain ATCC 10958 / CBS 173.52 / CDC B-1940 / NIH 8579) TaxID=1442370 RepID=A0A0D2IL46_CLAB1|nr:uncharacterized protein Z519_01078 [Cladophialophora bantiana CBS 173.52]KIW97494.1 hypothetical protein Z519_01078 [Cladophialophora bantiana CBS 173.52]
MDSQEKAALVTDIDTYLTGKDWYRKRGIKRLFVPPATGRGQDLVDHSACSAFWMSMNAIAFSEWLGDSVLQQLLRRIDDINCIMFLEDSSIGLDEPGEGKILMIEQTTISMHYPALRRD